MPIARARASVSAPATAQDPWPIGQWRPVLPAFGPIRLAQGKGYFKEAGFRNVELKFFPAGMMQLEAITDGRSLHRRLAVDSAGNVCVATLVNGGISVFLCTNLGNGPAGTQACPQEGTVTGTFTASAPFSVEIDLDALL